MYSIAFVLSDKRTGGFERQVERLAKYLNTDKYFECIIVYYSSSISACSSNANEVFLNIPKESKTRRLYFMITGLRNYFLNNPHDFIISGLHVNNVIMYLATIGLKSKRYISMRTAPSNYKAIYKLQHIVLSNLVEGVIYNNKNTKQYFQRFCPREVSHLLPNTYQYLHKEKVYRDNISDFGVLGRNSKEKNHSLVVNGWCHIDMDFSLIIKGPGHQSKTEGKIEFQDEFTDVDDFYNRIDCLIVPSFSEGFPNVVLEAWARGVIVAITDSANSAGIVEDGYTGFVFENSIDGLIRVVSRIASFQPHDLLVTRENALRVLNENYRPDVILEKLKNILI